MPDLKNIQETFFNLRNEQVDNNIKINQSRAKLEQLNRKVATEIKGLSAEERTKRIADFERERNAIQGEMTQAAQQASSLKDSIRDLSAQNLSQLDPQTAIQELDDQFPILMFPLRLETRFKRAGNQDQLLVRVYPDDCNIIKNESLLTEKELENTRLFWIEMWKAGGIETEERGAWRSLLKSHNSNRASWIIRNFKPLNGAPIKPDSTYKVLAIVSDKASTSDETIALASYWKSYWLANGDEAIIADAFEKLKIDLSITDAAATELIEAFLPVNIADPIPPGMTADKVLVSTLILPSSADYITTRTAWNDAPRAIGLPDRFMAVAYTGSVKKSFLFEHLVKEYLPVGPDPSLPEVEQINKNDNGDILLNEELQWMTDFDKAVVAGMATRINLSVTEATTGFDKLVVAGIRISSNELAGKHMLEELIADHASSKEGFSLLKQGTPTNNTEDEGSGYSWIEDADKSYDRIFKGADDFEDQTDYTKQADGQRLAECLGIDAAVLKNISGSNGRDQIEAHAMNTALFPATLGYFMEEMMDPLFTDTDINATKKFFSSFVSGRGALPAIRIGKQPYGILPASVFSHMDFSTRNIEVGTHAGVRGDVSFLSKLHQVISRLDSAWNQCLPEVSWIGKNKENPHQDLLDVIGLHANSAEFHHRYAQSLEQIYNQLNLQLRNPVFAAFIAAAISMRGKSILRELDLDEALELPILEKYFLSEPDTLQGPLVDDVPSSEVDPIRSYSSNHKNYIEWLRASDADKIRMEDFGAGHAAPNALLYLLLRHSLLLAQANAATNLLITNNVIDNKKIYFDHAFMHIQEQDSGKSKFEHLYNTQPEVTGDQTTLLMHYIYSPNVLNELVEVNGLKQILDALKELEKTPTARLERLLTEHLDCCNYRIDAWKQGLIQFRLLEQRKPASGNNRKGIYTGAYGWLLEVRPKQNASSDVTLDDKLTSIFNPAGTKTIVKDATNLGHIHAPSIDQAATAAILRNAHESNKGTGQNPFAIKLTSDRVRIANDFLEGIRNGQSLSALLGYQFERGLHDRYSSSGIEADKFIYPLRMAFPLVAENLQNSATTDSDLSDAAETNNASGGSRVIESIEAHNVIDGLKLIQHVQTASIKTYPFGLPEKFRLPEASVTDAETITSEINRLIEIHDGIADLAITEQVYQVVKGNFERASGVAEAFSKGSYPPEMEVVNTARTGIALSHKMAIHFNAEADPGTSPNSLSSMTPRAKAEPGINEWLSDIFPDPGKVRCKVTYKVPGGTESEVFVTQTNLGLQSIDLLYAANLDADHAMAELDDRIVNYVRYSVSHHPFTAIHIKYVEEIDPDDKSVVSFFELGTVIQSLRKILIGNKPVLPGDLFLPVGEDVTHMPMMEYSSLRTRVSALKAELEAIHNDLKSRINSTISISHLNRALEAQLLLHTTDELVIKSILARLNDDIRSYFVDPSADNRDFILTAFELSLAFVTDPADVLSLTSDYESFIDQYRSDFANFDILLRDTTELFSKVSYFDARQMGTGFIHQAVGSVYKAFFEKLEVVIKRWKNKKKDVQLLIDAYDPAASAEIRYRLLQKVETAISSEPTVPMPPVNDYKNAIDSKIADFNTVLNNLIALRSNNSNSIVGFINTVETVVAEIPEHDVIYFDIINSRNDLFQEKVALMSLKEHIFAALQNADQHVAKKLQTYSSSIAGIDAITSNAVKTEMQITAAKALLSEDALIVPAFTLDERMGNEVEFVYQQRHDIQDFVKTNENRMFPVDDWFSGVARVRPRAKEFENVMILSSGWRPDTEIEMSPLQFPYKENDRWLAMKFVKSKNETGYVETEESTFETLTGDRLLYTAHFAMPFDKSKPIAGIVVDEWTEVIPSKEETTGIAFHFDQPNSEPPNAMLLMVAPVAKGKWEWENVIAALEETLDMAMKRAVEPSMLEKTNYAQFVPPTMLAVTTHGITVSTNLAANNVSKTRNN